MLEKWSWPFPLLKKGHLFIMKIKYSEFVHTLRKDPVVLLSEKTPVKIDMDHAVFGICGEAGEIADAVKKHTIYNQPFDKARRDHLVEELGDMEFYLEQLRAVCVISREECIKANIEKLHVRYNGLKYSDKAAEVRADKL